MRKELAEARKVKKKAAAAAAAKASPSAVAKGALADNVWVVADKAVESVAEPPSYYNIMRGRGSCPVPRGVHDAGFTGCPVPVGDGVRGTLHGVALQQLNGVHQGAYWPHLTAFDRTCGSAARLGKRPLWLFEILYD